MVKRTYLDWNATSPLRTEAREAMAAAMDSFGNPSSVHSEGRNARGVVERAREQVAALIGAQPSLVTFTSGGTEANNLALTREAQTGDRRLAFDRLLISAIEHPSVRAGGRFAPDAVEDIPVTAQGTVAPQSLASRLATLTTQGQRALVSVMLANNETGIVQPIPEIARVVHEAGSLLHVDAVQASGRISININELGADLLSISAHKFGGPKGVGALIRRDEALHLPNPLIRGGGHERGLRGGTENVIGIAGMGAAAEAARRDLEADTARIAALRERLEEGLRAATPQVVIVGAEASRVPNTTLAAVPGMRAETAVIAFDLAGYALSAGAACSSGKVQGSAVLAAMGLPEELARGGLRISLGWTTTAEDIDGFIQAWIKTISALLREKRGLAA